MKFYRIFFFFFFFLSFPLFGLINEDKDFQFWIFDSWEKKLTEKAKCRLDVEFRYGDAASQLYLTYGQFIFLYQPRGWLEWGVGYRHLNIYFQSKDRWRTIYEPYGEIVLKFSIEKWKCEDRNRIEYLIPESLRNAWLYRNRLRFISPWKLTTLKLVPYVEDEIFFLEYRGFFQNRFTVGGLIEVTDYLKIRTFYMLRYANFINGWRQHNILGLYFHFKF